MKGICNVNLKVSWIHDINFSNLAELWPVKSDLMLERDKICDLGLVIMLLKPETLLIIVTWWCIIDSKVYNYERDPYPLIIGYVPPVTFMITEMYSIRKVVGILNPTVSVCVLYPTIWELCRSPTMNHLSQKQLQNNYEWEKNEKEWLKISCHNIPLTNCCCK